MATKEGHEDVCKGRKTFIKGGESPFTAESITEKHDHEINRIVRAEACASKLHVLLDGCEQADMAQNLSKGRHFSHPAWG